MAVTVTIPNHIKYLLATKQVDFLTDTFKVILMNSTFSFDRDSHEIIVNVNSSQLATGNGYTQNNKTLTGVSILEDDTNDRAQITWDNPEWTASGGSIGPTASAIIYDDTVANDPIVMHISFGTTYTIVDTASFSIKNITFYVS